MGAQLFGALSALVHSFFFQVRGCGAATGKNLGSASSCTSWACYEGAERQQLSLFEKFLGSRGSRLLLLATSFFSKVSLSPLSFPAALPPPPSPPVKPVSPLAPPGPAIPGLPALLSYQFFPIRQKKTRKTALQAVVPQDPEKTVNHHHQRDGHAQPCQQAFRHRQWWV